jgi:hypothetical protein
MPCPHCRAHPGFRAPDAVLPLVVFEPLEGNDPELQRWGPPKICGGCGVVFCERKPRTTPPAPAAPER